jgi:predicted nucleic acid-binding protein
MTEAAAVRYGPRLWQCPLRLNAIGEVELLNAISLRLFRNEIPASTAKASLALLLKDVSDGVLAIVPIATAAIERAKQIARKRTAKLGTQTLDILHVASALALGCNVFLTFDARQEALALSQGLQVR